MSIPAITLLADLSGSAFGSPNPTTDLSTYLETSGDGSPISVTWGRNDEQSSASPRVFSFVLDNTDGRFTTGAQIITTAHFMKVRVTVGGTTYDRAAGYVESVEAVWSGGSSSYSLLRVTCVDISGRLGEAQPLRSMLVHEMLADSPTYLYPLGEANPSTSAADLVSSSNPVAVRVDAKVGGTTADFGAQMTGLLDSDTGVQFGAYTDAYQVPVSVMAIAYNSATAPNIPTSGPWTIECWALMPSAPPTAANVGWNLLYHAFAPSSSGGYVIVNVGSSGVPQVSVQPVDATVFPKTVGGSTSACDGNLHHLVVTFGADGKTIRMFVDGVQTGTQAFAAAATFGMRYNEVGGTVGLSTGGTASSWGQFPGAISHVALYPSELSAARILAHYQAGKGTGPVERSDQRFSRLLGYQVLTTSGLPTGQASMAGQRTKDKTLVAALQQVADTEGGAFYVTGSGSPTMTARNARYWPTAAFTAAATEIDPSAVVRRDRQGLVNDQTATRDGGAAQRVQNASSISTYGRRDGGELQVAPSTDFDAKSNAGWRVAAGKTPQTRIAPVVFDLLSQTTTSLVQSVCAATIGTAFTITGLPSQAPGGTSQTFFVEGGREQIGVDAWSVELFTSPSSSTPNTLRADAAASARTKLDNGLVIPF